MTTIFDLSGHLRLVLAADARLATTHYTDDQVWEFSTAGEPASLAVQTTYGLRARSMRIFPCFITAGETRIDPSRFVRPPRLIRAYPNFCSLEFSPIQDIDVLYDLWVPESQVITARVSLRNSGLLPSAFRCEVAAQLTPLKDGQVMTTVQEQVNTLLQGQSSGLAPVLFLTGGPDAGRGSYPSLGLDMHLEPAESRTVYWASAALSSPHESFELARRSTARPWEAELTRIELTHQSTQMEIESGNPEWDVVFSLAQNQAARLLMGSSPSLPEMSFVAAREPDHGYPGEEQGTSHGILWNGQTVFQALGLSGILLTGSEEIVRGWVRNQLSTQDKHGRVDWKPGLAGQRGRLHAQPALATLALRASQGEGGSRFLASSYDGLLRYLMNWFHSDNDRDEDGFPEWEHPFQVGFDDQSVFDRWRSDGTGLEINTVESPALGAWLYQECASLGEIARQTSHDSDLAALELLQDKLRVGVQACWNAQAGRFSYRDRDLHTTTSQETLFQGPAGAHIPVELGWENPRRLQIQVRESQGSGTAYRLRLNGKLDAEDLSETLKLRGSGWATSQLVYSRLEWVEVEGSSPGNELWIGSPDLDAEDLSLYLPLWAGLPTAEQAQEMITNLMRRYLSPFGLAQLPELQDEWKISPLWNALILEGMLRYGFAAEAAEVFQVLMESFKTSLSHQGAFYQYYQAADGLGVGIRGHLEGLPSLQTYLRLIGLQIHSPWMVLVEKTCALPGPFTVKYRGLKYMKQNNSSRVTFPDGQSLPIENPGEYRLNSARGKHPPRN